MHRCTIMDLRFRKTTSQLCWKITGIISSMFKSNVVMLFTMCYLLVFRSVANANRCDASKFGNLLANSALKTAVFEKLNPGGLALCARECLYRTRCKSFNYVDSFDTCLLNGDSIATGATEVRATGTFYSDITTWPKRIANYCQQHTCTADQQCKPDQNSPSPSKHTCVDIYFHIEQAAKTRLYGSVFDTVTSATVDDCVKECFNRKSCVSFNYFVATQKCELNSQKLYTDYINYEGNDDNSFYSNIDKYDQAVAGACATRPCADNEVCSVDMVGTGNKVCTPKFCKKPTQLFAVDNVVAEFDQTVDLWPLTTNLKYNCKQGYYPDTDWLCQSNGTFANPTCTNMVRCMDMFGKCNVNLPDGKYVLHFPGTNEDVIYQCIKSTGVSNWVNNSKIAGSSYAKYAGKTTDECKNVSGALCGQSTFGLMRVVAALSSLRVLVITSSFKPEDAHVASCGDVEGPFNLQTGKNCDPDCSNGQNGTFVNDLRGSGFKHENYTDHTAVLTYSHDDQVVHGVCSECGICKQQSVTLLPGGTDIDYSDAVQPTCTSRGGPGEA